MTGDHRPYGDPGEIDMMLDQDDLEIFQQAVCMWRFEKQAEMATQPLPPGVASLYCRSHTLLDRVSQALAAFQYERQARDARMKAMSTQLRGASLED